MFLDLGSFVKGFGTCASLITTIGAQNSFLLRRGLEGRHVFATAVTCSVCDALLISVGVFGVGSALTLMPVAQRLLLVAGGAFLLAYGMAAVRRGTRGSQTLLGGPGAGSLAATVWASLGFSLLNPHAYLDAVFILGGVASSLPNRVPFAGGAIVASAGWFFFVGYGARFLQPCLRQPKAWAAFEVGNGAVMIWLALGLWRHLSP